MMCATWRENRLTESFAKRQGTIADNIIWLAKNHPSVIQDYRKLIQYYWYYIDGLKVFIPLNIIEGLTQPESVGRAFRKLKSEGYIVEDDKTKRLRLQSEENFREYYGRKNY